MVSTEKVSLSLDAGALVLARRAAEIEDTNLSAYVSRLIMRYAWESERPALAAAEQSAADARTVELDAQDEAGWTGDQRAAG